MTRMHHFVAYTYYFDPSKIGICGLAPTVVRVRPAFAWVVQNWFNAARRLSRCRVRSTERERNAAIWRRLTVPAGS